MGDAQARQLWTELWLSKVNRRLAGHSAEDLLAWGIESYSPAICLATGFGPQSIVLMHMLREIRSETTIFYLDTDLLFEETYALIERLQRRLGLNFERIPAVLDLAEQSARYGEQLWTRDPDRCCRLRKVVPLRRFLADKEAWITGLRRDSSPSRAQIQRVQWDAANGLVKLNPLVDWSEKDVRAYIDRHRLPTNPLHERGYPSLGCRPCTRRVCSGEEPRSGRWPGFDKTECGIHTD